MTVTQNPEQAWFTGEFSPSGDNSHYRIYIYPGTNSTYPADIRSSTTGDEEDFVFAGEVRFDDDTLYFHEIGNSGHPENPKWICTLSARKKGDDSYEGSPSDGTGLFEPALALKIAQMEAGVKDSPEGRALAAQIQTLKKRAKPVTISVTQFEPAQSTLH